MSPTCLAAIQQTNRDFLELFDEGIAAALALLVLMVFSISALVVPIAIRRHTSLVRRMMRLQRVAAIPVTSPLTNRTDRGYIPDQFQHRSIEGVSFETLELASRSRFTRLRCATWGAYGVYVALATAALMAESVSIGGVTSMGGLLFIGASAIVPALINIRPSVPGRVLAPAALVATMGVLLFDENLGPVMLEDIVYVLVGLLMILSCYFAIAHRSFRTLIFSTTVFVAVALVGICLAVSLGGALFECSRVGVGTLEQSFGWVGGVVSIFIFTAFLFVARKMVAGIVWLHERGIGSDTSLTALSGLILTTFLLVLAVGDDVAGEPNIWLLPAAMGCMAITIATYCLLVTRGERSTVHRSLLVLRVFSADRAAEKLLDEIQMRWRYVGPVYQIGGPDLSHLNIDAYEFSKFLSSKLHEVFLLDPVGADHIRAQLNRLPDREGRFRVNEVFCLDSAWRSAVEQLIDMSDAILLDLRGFNAERSGTSFEVDLLARRGMLSRVVAFGDGKTDWSYFEGLVHSAGVAGGVVHRDTSTISADDLVTALMHGSFDSMPTGEVGLGDRRGGVQQVPVSLH